MMSLNISWLRFLTHVCSQHVCSTTTASLLILEHASVILTLASFSTELSVAGFLFLWISIWLGFPCFSTCQSVRHIMSAFSDSQRESVSEALAPSYVSSLGWPGTPCIQLRMVLNLIPVLPPSRARTQLYVLWQALRQPFLRAREASLLSHQLLILVSYHWIILSGVNEVWIILKTIYLLFVI